MTRKRLLVILAVFLLAIGVVALALYSFPKTTASTPNDEYVVRPGDTCNKIAFEQGIPAESLIEANGLAPDCSDLSVGRTLILPTSAP